MPKINIFSVVMAVVVLALSSRAIFFPDAHGAYLAAGLVLILLWGIAVCFRWVTENF